MPRKRFAKPLVLEKGKEYLGTEHTYRRTAEQEGMPIMYDEGTGKDQEGPLGLAPSTIWRWLSWLGSMPNTFRTICGLIRQKDPNTLLHRQPWAVPPTKYRSAKRQNTLEQAMQLLAADRVCEKLFGEGIFPRYATLQG